MEKIYASSFQIMNSEEQDGMIPQGINLYFYGFDGIAI